MDKDRNNYWHMRTPYDTAAGSRRYHEDLSFRNCFQLYANTLVGANVAGASLEVTPLRLLAKAPVVALPQMAAEESAKSLYVGVSSLLLRAFIFNSLRVTLYDVLRRKYFYMDKDKNQMVSIPGALLSGGFAGCVVQALYHPIQLLHLEASSWASALKAIQSNSLWRSMPLSCTQACLFTLGDVAVYDLCKRNLRKQLQLSENLALYLPAALLAGLAASLLSHPAEVIRLRLLNERGNGLHYEGATECLVKIMREEGAMKLYKGLLPACLRSSAWSVIFWLCVEQLREWEGQMGF
ncbi:hypothetical protein KR044_010036 [Drosophila immigrans]|nr:hypothetical protein KR044_010036 [Drosophila immigrans]